MTFKQFLIKKFIGMIKEFLLALAIICGFVSYISLVIMTFGGILGPFMLMSPEWFAGPKDLEFTLWVGRLGSIMLIFHILYIYQHYVTEYKKKLKNDNWS